MMMIKQLLNNDNKVVKHSTLLITLLVIKLACVQYALNLT